MQPKFKKIKWLWEYGVKVKMKVPFNCRIKVIFSSKKPTNFYGCCIGLKTNKKRCNNCDNYIPKLIYDGFLKGLNSDKYSLTEQLARAIKEYNRKE